MLWVHVAEYNEADCRTFGTFKQLRLEDQTQGQFLCTLIVWRGRRQFKGKVLYTDASAILCLYDYSSAAKNSWDQTICTSQHFYKRHFNFFEISEKFSLVTNNRQHCVYKYIKIAKRQKFQYNILLTDTNIHMPGQMIRFFLF